MEVKNKIVWITGASSGIGEALCYKLNQAGAKLIISSEVLKACIR
jgi:dehydrogenase/reductase SDR family protein 7B